MPYNLSLSMVVALGVLAPLLLLLLGWVYRYQRLRVLRLQHQGIAWLQALRTLMAHIQQHRGLVTGYLNGDTSMLSQIKALQIEISRDVSAIAGIGEWIEENERWQGITEHWARLVAGYGQRSANSNLLQHNLLITNIMHLIAEVAAVHHLRRLVKKAHRGREYFWNELLQMGECIGQARALGTGIAAAGKCDSETKARLRDLYRKIEKGAERLRQHQGATAADLSTLPILLNCINDKILGEYPTIDSREYFQLATQVLDGVLEQFDRQLEQLRQGLSHSQRKVLSSRRWAKT